MFKPSMFWTTAICIQATEARLNLGVFGAAFDNGCGVGGYYEKFIVGKKYKMFVSFGRAYDLSVAV